MISIELEPGSLYTLKDNVIMPIYTYSKYALRPIKYRYINSGMYSVKKHVLLYIKRYKSATGVPCYNEYYEFLYKSATIYLKIEDLGSLKRL